MELTHSFTVPVDVDQAFQVLTDIERVAPCMPGATVESVDGREFTGRVKVKVGPMQITYRGKARFSELDPDNHTVAIEARGQETRGSGTANATVTATLTGKGDQTEVTVVSNLAVTGRPAQFGRGVMNDVGAKLLGQFADCLSQRLAGEEDEIEDTTELTPRPPTASRNGASAQVPESEMTRAAGAASPQPASAAEPAAAAAPPLVDAPAEATQPAAGRTPRPAPAPSDDAIDLFGVAGPSIAKRLAPAALVLLVIVWLWRRRRS